MPSSDTPILLKLTQPKKLNTELTDVGANVNKVRQKPTTTVKPWWDSYKNKQFNKKRKRDRYARGTNINGRTLTWHSDMMNDKQI